MDRQRSALEAGWCVLAVGITFSSMPAPVAYPYISSYLFFLFFFPKEVKDKP